MSALTLLGGTTALLAASITLIRRRLSRHWLTLSTSLTNPTPLTKQHVIILTGANTGLGYQTALDLAQRGGTVVLACRNVAAGERAACTIRSLTHNDDVVSMELDLASFQSICTFASEVKRRYPTIYAVVCNAGVWMPMERRQKTKEGYEIHFGVNHLGHFLLIRELMPHMISSGVEGRVVWVSSSLSKRGVVDVDKKDFVEEGRVPLEKSFAPTGYCDSKLMNVLTCRHFAKEFEAEGNKITTYSVCPGFCVSELGRYVTRPWYQKIFVVPMMRLFQRSTVQGAQNIVFVTLQDKSKLVNGGFYQDGRVNEEMMTSHQEVETPLWNLSMELIREKQ